ncbi:DNA binding protein-like protein [Carex littledalei]|uniref:DNA binding protein-like protein n=1 Tax=Carex littledalei TaxID=544730 RepID=A0A833W177_9POAL|nr:DNA binding protein-like protein [Carex littledalei]
MRYLLVDTEETGIEAEITKADQSLLPVKPDDGNVYLFWQFRVETPNNGYNATGHNFIIRMTKWTEARRIDNLAVQPPLFYFNFKEFEDIGTTIRGSRVVVDVIGRISSIGPVEQINTQSGLTDIRDILIENIRGKTLRITLWPTFMPLINEPVISEASKHSPVVYAFSSLELKSYNREPFLKTYSATKIYTDQTHPHIAQYLELYRLILRVTDGDATAEFTLIEKQAENIINKKADMVFAESRRTGKMVPPSLENIYGKRFLFIVEINISQLHKQRLSYDVNKVEAVPAVLPQPPQTHRTLPNIREDHFSTVSESRISTPKRKAAHTGLSPQAAHLYIESSMDNPTSSQSSASKRKILPQLNEENSTSRQSSGYFSMNNPIVFVYTALPLRPNLSHLTLISPVLSTIHCSVLRSADDESSNTTTP